MTTRLGSSEVVTGSNFMGVEYPPRMLFVLSLLFGCQRAAPTVVLISMDTTRADALSVYGGPAQTPALDALAERGLVAEWGLSQSATTLASHTAVFSGLDPHRSGIVRNGFPVNPETPLLQERFAAEGWDRIAVVGSTALEPDMGLSRGFRVYDDHGLRAVNKRYEVGGDAVTAAALKHLDAQESAQPTLLFVHYYDPHTPWNSAPEAAQQAHCAARQTPKIDGSNETAVRLGQREFLSSLEAADVEAAWCLYEAELAWTDQNIGALLDGLEERGRLKDALVVVFSDHGEHMGSQHGSPFGHGPDVDPDIVHVPLIWAGTGRFSGLKGRLDRPIRLMDLGPSILGLLGWEHTLGDGEDTSPILRGERSWEAPPSFAEATQPAQIQKVDGWNNLPFQRSVTQDGYTQVLTPYLSQQQLFALGSPVRAIEDPQRTQDMKAQLQAWDAQAPGFRQWRPTTQTIEALKALGYLE